MLPADHRLTDPASFRRASKLGRRSGARTLVTHLLVDPADAAGPARVGFVVGRGVGTAVARNRVRRRLRHAVAERIASLPPSSLLVVRAQAAARDASYRELARDLDRCLDRSLDRPDPARSAQVSR